MTWSINSIFNVLSIIDPIMIKKNNFTFYKIFFTIQLSVVFDNYNFSFNISTDCSSEPNQ